MSARESSSGGACVFVIRIGELEALGLAREQKLRIGPEHPCDVFPELHEALRLHRRHAKPELAKPVEHDERKEHPRRRHVVLVDRLAPRVAIPPARLPQEPPHLRVHHAHLHAHGEPLRAAPHAAGHAHRVNEPRGLREPARRLLDEPPRKRERLVPARRRVPVRKRLQPENQPTEDARAQEQLARPIDGREIHPSRHALDLAKQRRDRRMRIRNARDPVRQRRLDLTKPLSRPDVRERRRHRVRKRIGPHEIRRDPIDALPVSRPRAPVVDEPCGNVHRGQLKARWTR